MTTAMEIGGKRISVIGAGMSGIGLACLAARLGGRVFVSDEKPITDKSVPTLFHSLDIAWEDGGHSSKVFEADCILVGSGVSPNAAPVIEAGKRMIPVTGELDFIAPLLSGKVIGVTGSNGKSTTTALIGHLLERAGFSVEVTGNIGKSLAESALEKKDYFVVELSSFQLHWNTSFACDLAIVTNLAPDHIDWHGSYEKYVRAKAKILSTRKADGYSIIQERDRSTLLPSHSERLNDVISFYWNNDNIKHRLPAVIADEKRRVVSLFRTDGESEELFDFDSVPLIGKHNIENAAFAACAVRMLSGKGVVHPGLFGGFRGLAHRCEFVATINGITYVDDSKGTNVAASATAMRSLPGKKIIILGGQGKGEDYEPLAKAVKDEVDAAVLLGAEKKRIAEALRSAGYENIHEVSSMEEAVNTASKIAPPRSTVLLSPACTSWDMYPNYKKRGEDFRNIVLRIKKEVEQ